MENEEMENGEIEIYGVDPLKALCRLFRVVLRAQDELEAGRVDLSQADLIATHMYLIPEKDVRETSVAELVIGFACWLQAEKLL